MNKKELMYKRIEEHGNNLNSIFNTGIDNITLSKKLHRLEYKAHSLATSYCNGETPFGERVDTENIEELLTPIMKQVYKLLNNGEYKEDRPHQRGVPVFWNGDCRGYALKINDDYVKMLEKTGKTIYKDWGGFGILSPNFSEV